MRRQVRSTSAIWVVSQVLLTAATPYLLRALPPRARPGGALFAAVVAPVVVARLAKRLGSR